MRYRRSKEKGATFFFTVVTFKRNGILCREDSAALIREAFQHVNKRHPFTVDAFVMLPDHIHCIFTLPQGDSDFSVRWQMIKSHFTRGCRSGDRRSRPDSRIKKVEHGVWQRRFWEHQIRDDEDFKRHVEYIHYNPVKHGLAASPGVWPYSSFHRYVKQGVYDADWCEDREMELESNVGRE